MYRFSFITAGLTLAVALVAGCAGNGNLPKHNHKEGAVVAADGSTDPTDAKLQIWKLGVAGAT